MDNNDVLDAALELFFRSNLAKPREVRPLDGHRVRNYVKFV